ncbi:hypothetical protein PJI17_32655, partial [Mycobacterium kansasii]
PPHPRPSCGAAVPGLHAVVDLYFPPRLSTDPAESVGFFQVVNHGVPARHTESIHPTAQRNKHRHAAANAAFYTPTPTVAG